MIVVNRKSYLPILKWFKKVTLLKLLTCKAPKKEVDNQSKIGTQVMENNLKWLNKIADASAPKIEKSLKSSTKKASKRPSNSSSTKPNQDRRKVQKRGGDHSPSGTPSSADPATLKLTTHRSIEASKEAFSDHDEAKENSVPEPPQDRQKLIKKVGQTTLETSSSNCPITSSRSNSSKGTNRHSKEAFSAKDEANENSVPEPPQDQRKSIKRVGQIIPGTPGSDGPANSPRPNSSKLITHHNKEVFSDDDEVEEMPEPPQNRRKVIKRGSQSTPGTPGFSKSSSSKSTIPCSKEALSDDDEAKETPEPPQNRQKIKKRGGQSTLGTPSSTTPAASPRTSSSKCTTRRSKEAFSDDEETKETPEPFQYRRKVKKRGGDETPGIPLSAGSSKINHSAKRIFRNSKEEFSDHDEAEEKNMAPNNSTKNDQSDEFLEDSLEKTPTQDRRKVQKMQSHSPLRTPNSNDVSSRRNTRHRRSEAMKSPATPEINAPEMDIPEIDAPEIDTPEMDTPEIDTPEMDIPKTDALESDTPVLVKSVALRSFELTKSPALPEVDQSDLDTLEMNTSEQDKREMVKPELETPGKDLPFVCVLPDCGQRFAVKRVSC